MDDRDHLIAVCGIIDTLLIRRRELIRGHIQDAATKRAEPLPAERQHTVERIQRGGVVEGDVVISDHE